MTVRTLGIISILAALAMGGWLYATQMRAIGPTSEAGQRAVSDASAATLNANFQAAGATLTSYLAQNGTYAGVTVPPSYGVTVVHADAASYCLQAGTGANAQHVVGPGGQPAPGPC